MPFTGSHPAAVLPLIRLGLPPSALVIGSMAADLPYYLPIPVDSTTTHSATGVLGVDLLIGLLSLVVWQTLVAPLAVAVAPSALRARLPPAAARWWLPGDLRRPLLVVVALVAGAATHVIWDEFTHIGRFGYRHLPWLAEQHGPLAGYRWAQYGSGVVGAVLILLALQRWWRHRSGRRAGLRRAHPADPATGAVRVLVGVIRPGHREDGEPHPGASGSGCLRRKRRAAGPASGRCGWPGPAPRPGRRAPAARPPASRIVPASRAARSR